MEYTIFKREMNSLLLDLSDVCCSSMSGVNEIVNSGVPFFTLGPGDRTEINQSCSSGSS